MKKIYLLIILASVLLIAGCTQNSEITPVQPNEKANTVSDKEPNTIVITSNGFSPDELKIKAGDTVTWINNDKNEHWPASAKHPTHTVYPGSDIKKCGTSEQDKIFDACKGLKEDESWSFTFNEKGTWFYHDHLDVSLFSKIIVQ